MTTEPQTLEYAKRAPLAWVSRHKRPLLSFALLVLIATGLYHFREPLKQRALWLYWSHQCATFQMPANVKVMVDDPADVQRLSNDADYVPAKNFSGPNPALFYRPNAWQQLVQLDSRTGWIRGWLPEKPIAFLGSMRRPDGQSRLVILQGWSVNGYDILYDLQLLILPHPGLFDPIPPPMGTPGSAYSGLWTPARIDAARLDPNNPSHLSFTLHTVTASGTVDAYLQNDDSLRFQMQPNPEFDRTGISLGRTTTKSGVIPQTFLDEMKRVMRTK
jgi:hypothetical protein